MRKIKVVQVEGRGEVTVKEVSPWGLYQAWNAGADKAGELLALLNDAVHPGFDEVRTWYPSELEQVVAGFLEVNEAFFGIAARLQLDGALREMLAALTNSLPAAFAASLKQAMATPGTTAGLSS